ncbi:unnamed protein product [Clonostachys rosea]|uniref:C2H2-type domain-containing protein n=1 Tax=Bionectria ochroleuca TaxID=29856 RepID=A0ABY6UHJ9_BIOOC|nr:unnamed protein product [Clonostachys rosea]
MSDTPPILDTPDCQNESQQLSEALEECVRSFTHEHQKLKTPKAAYLAKCLELEALSSTSDASMPTSPLELRMFRTNAMEHGRILGKMRENMPKDQEDFEKAHSQARERLVDQLFFLLGPLLTERAKRGPAQPVQCPPSPSPQPEITLGQAIEEDSGDHRLPASDSEHEQVVSPKKKQPKKTKTKKSTPRSRSIEFEDVYQDGKPDQRRFIVRYPENHGHWYVLHCERHDLHFDAIAAGASHLSHADHGGKKLHPRAVIQELGVLVLRCSVVLAKKNNALLNPKSSHSAKRKTSSTQEHDRKRSRASSPSSQRRRSNAPEVVRNAEEAPARRQNQTATATTSSDSKPPGSEFTPPPEKAYESILNPVAGAIYFCLVSETRSYVPVLILPMDMDDPMASLEAVGILGTLVSLGLMDDLPNAFVQDPVTKKLTWAEQYDEKGKLAAKRAFPAIYLTSKKFPEGCPVAWVAAMDLRLWDLGSASVPLTLNEHGEVLKYIIHEREKMGFPRQRFESAETIEVAGEPMDMDEAAGEATRADTPLASGDSLDVAASRASSVTSKPSVGAEKAISRPTPRPDIEIIEILSSSESEDESEETTQPAPPSLPQQNPDDAMEAVEPPVCPPEDADGKLALKSAIDANVQESTDLPIATSQDPDEDGPKPAVDENVQESMDLPVATNAGPDGDATSKPTVDTNAQESIDHQTATNASPDGEATPKPTVDENIQETMDLLVATNDGPDEDGLKPATPPSMVTDEAIDALMDATLRFDEHSMADAPSPPPISDKDIDDATATAASPAVAIKHDIEPSGICSPPTVSDTSGDTTQTISTSIATPEDIGGVENMTPVPINGCVDDMVESKVPTSVHRDAEEALETAHTPVSDDDFDEPMEDASPLAFPDGDDHNMMDMPPPSAVPREDLDRLRAAPPVQSSTPTPISSEDLKALYRSIYPPVSDCRPQEAVSDPLPADKEQSQSPLVSDSPGRPIQSHNASTPAEERTDTERSSSLFNRGSSDASQTVFPTLSHSQGIEGVDQRDFAFFENARHVSRYISYEKPAEETHTPVSTTSPSNTAEEGQRALAYPQTWVASVAESASGNCRPEQSSMSCPRLEPVRVDVDLTHSEDDDHLSSRVAAEANRQPSTSAVRPRLPPATAATFNKPLSSPKKSNPAPHTKPKATKTRRYSNARPALASMEQQARAPPPHITASRTALPGSRIRSSIANLLTKVPDNPATQHHSPQQTLARSVPTVLPRILPGTVSTGTVSTEPENANTSWAVRPPPSKHGFANILNHSPVNSNRAYTDYQHEICGSALVSIPSLQQLAAHAAEVTAHQQTVTHRAPVDESTGMAYTQRPAITYHSSHNRQSSQGSVNSRPQSSGWQPTTVAGPSGSAQCSPRLLQEEARQALEQMQSSNVQRSGSLDQHDQRHVAFQQGLPSPTHQPTRLSPQYANYHDPHTPQHTAETRMERREPYDCRAPLSPADSQNQFPSCPSFAFASGGPQLLEPHALPSGPEYGSQPSVAEIREVQHQRASPQRNPHQASPQRNPHQRISPPIHHHNSFTPHNHRAQLRPVPQAPTPETNHAHPEAGHRMGPTPPAADLGQETGAHDLKWTAVSQAASSAPWLATPPGGAHEQIQEPRRSGANDYKVNIQSMRSAQDTYLCDYCPSKGKKHYNTAGWLKKHLEQVHGVASRSMI